MSINMNKRHFSAIARSLFKAGMQQCGLLFALFFSAIACAQLPELPLASSLSGEPTSAKFFGGVSADNGVTYSASVGYDQAVDVLAEIQVEAGHVGTVGNLYVIIVLGEDLFMRDASGNYQLWNGDPATLLAASPDKILTVSESISIVEDIPFGPAGVSDTALNIFLAYDTAAAADELYYSGAPLSFTIEPEAGAISLTYYISNISAPIVQTRCIACHTSAGLANTSALIYQNSSVPGYQTSNYNTLIDYLENAPNGSSLILSKPQGVLHGGGEQLAEGSADFQLWSEFVSLSLTDIANSGGGGQVQSIFNLVSKMDSQQTLRKAALLFAGRLPTESESDAVVGASDEELRNAIRDLMQGDSFREFLIEGANDQLLTEAFASSLFNIVDRYYYPNSMQYYQTTGNRTERLLVAASLALEPMQLIAHVVINERPYTEVLTADYIVVNPYSAEIYGGNVAFNDATDFNEWREGEITEYYRCSICNQNSPLVSYDIPTVYPHAGILNSPAFLSRYPSTSTNRNRARARWAYYLFLGVDIEGLSERTTDPEALADENNPTLNNPNCVVCHTIMDPVAGAFQNYGDDGFYRDQRFGENSLPGSYRNDPNSGFQLGDTWYSDMLPPGFIDKLAPNPDNSLQWLAQEFVNDSRFGTGTVNFWYAAVMGRDPYDQPENPEDADYQSSLAAYSTEQQLMQAIAADFVAGAAGNGAHNLKDLLVDLAMSDHFRSESVSEMTAVQAVELEEVGSGKLLTPEQLNRKLLEVTGYEWSYGSASALELVYNLVYGGIDSFGITERATDLTTLMSTVVTAMANEVSCSIAAKDFSLDQAQRKLFTSVELYNLPTTSSAAIRSNIQYLHKQMLGEELSSNDPEIDATFALFEDVWNARIAANNGASVNSASEICIFENIDDPVTSDANQILRSWAVVINYLLRDYKFIHE